MSLENSMRRLSESGILNMAMDMNAKGTQKSGYLETNKMACRVCGNWFFFIDWVK
jgi:hypothetical protein